MPNHVNCSLSVTSGKPLGEVIKPYLTDDGKNIDFNKIIPMPECILESLKFGDISYITEKRTPEQEAEEKAKQKANETLCLEETGHKNWYDWSVANWDTKWNAYSCYTLEDDFNKVEDLTDLGFQTAWSPPINVIRNLAKLTGESFRMSYFDEGWMFAGEYLVDADGSEHDNCYDDMDNIPEGTELWEECDLASYYENGEEDED